MTRSVFAHQGSLDKYIGDAVMAVFGAPLADPRHPAHACRAALDMLRALAELQATWRSAGRPVFDIGIGIHTGSMIVGNMGSVERFNYTVVGDAVNLASRIESLNKDYGTNLLISASTWAHVQNEFPRAREVDRVRVKGRAQYERVFELIPEGKYGSFDWLEDYAAAYRLMREGDAARAAGQFDALYARVADPVSAFHARACRVPQRRATD
jgi:adenylate cyclase